MPKGFETVTKYVRAGEYKKAVNLLWEQQSVAQVNLESARALVEVASELRAKAGERYRGDCDHFIDWGEKCIEKLSGKPLEVLRADALAVIEDCKVLGGHGLPVQVATSVALVFKSDELVLLRFEPIAVVPYAEIAALEIGGPGAQRQGGGFIGGGFGLAGAAEGMLIGAALNSLTTRTTIDTVVCLKTTSAELFLHTSSQTPNVLRMRLSPVFTILRQLEANQGATQGDGGASAVDRLAKLADLLEKNLITREEFDALKADLLSGRTY